MDNYKNEFSNWISTWNSDDIKNFLLNQFKLNVSSNDEEKNKLYNELRNIVEKNYSVLKNNLDELEKLYSKKNELTNLVETFSKSKENYFSRENEINLERKRRTDRLNYLKNEIDNFPKQDLTSSQDLLSKFSKLVNEYQSLIAKHNFLRSSEENELSNMKQHFSNSYLESEKLDNYRREIQKIEEEISKFGNLNNLNYLEIFENIYGLKNKIEEKNIENELEEQNIDSPFKNDNIILNSEYDVTKDEVFYPFDFQENLNEENKTNEVENQMFIDDYFKEVNQNINDEEIIKENNQNNIDFKQEEIVKPDSNRISISDFTKYYIKNQKYKSYKNSNPGHIKPIIPSEIEEINIYNNDLDENIDRFLSEPHNNYKLELQKLRLESEYELIKKRIDIRKNFNNISNVSKFSSFLQKLRKDYELNALENQLSTIEKSIEKIDNKINNYDNTSLLTKINDNYFSSKEVAKLNSEISFFNTELLDSEKLSQSTIDKVQTYLSKAVDKRNKLGTKLKINNRNSLKDSMLVAYNFTKTALNEIKNLDKLKSM